MNLLLIGPRASGKTTVGRALAFAGSVTFVDLDDVALMCFETDGLRTITEVFERRGEPVWRAAETVALEAVLARDDQVIALGGGTPMIDAARAMVTGGQQSGAVVVVYLRCDAAELTRRLLAVPGDRPSLTGEDVAAEAAAVLAEREATYLDLADIVVEAGESLTSVLADTLAQLEAR